MYTGKVQKSGKGRKSAIRHLKPAQLLRLSRCYFALLTVQLASALHLPYLCADHTAQVCIP